MTSDGLDVLKDLLPGFAVKKIGTMWDNVEEPKVIWDSKTQRWAVYLIESEYLSSSKIESIKKAKQHSFNPLIIITDHSQLSSIANYYLDLSPYMICRIAGKATLINPLSDEIVKSFGYKKVKHRSRINLALLKEISKNSNIPLNLKKSLTKLVSAYQNLSSETNKDEYEQQILEIFGNSILRNMGLSGARLKAAIGVRAIELSKLIIDRDHFFHSFQIYFLGLLAISRLKTYFDNWIRITKLNWAVNPFDVWFLTALWHDVGYTIQKYPELSAIIFDSPDCEVYASHVMDGFLNEPNTQKAIRDISSVIPRLLIPTEYSTTWVRQDDNTRKTPKQRKIISALENNYLNSHGAVSAIKLHRDLIQKVDRMSRDSVREVLFQTILIACCSIPFHDWRFRKSLREHYGPYKISNNVMPFAATLAFIDSIQEDCRNLSEMRGEIRFLEKLIIKRPRFVEAQLNIKALKESDIIWKIIESRDVYASLSESDHTLSFIYPPWMIN